jgi:D-alanyl-D-alanine carboxypeptidase
MAAASIQTSPHQPATGRERRSAVARGICLLVAVGAVGIFESVSPRLVAAATLQPSAFAGPLDELATSYDIDATVDFDAATADVVETIRITNGSPAPLSGVHLSVPAAVTDRFRLGSLEVEGTAVVPTVIVPGDLEVPLPTPAPQATSVHVRLQFEVQALANTESSLDTRLSKADGILRLGHWLALVSTSHGIRKPGDAQVTAAADLFRLRLHLSDPSLVVAAPGEVEHASGPTRTYEIAHARDLALAIARDFHVTRSVVDGTAVEVYTRPGVDGEVALRFASRALRAFAAQYGPYPWSRYVLVQSPRRRSGNEYPGIVFLGRESLRDQVVVAHETAHQWFYAVVGNDQIREPWIDEALAEFSADHTFGHLEASCSTRVVDLPITAFPDRRPDDEACSEYSQTVYVKGAWMVDGVRRLLGDDRFYPAMRALVARDAYRIVTGMDVIATWRAFAPDDAALVAYLDPYFFEPLTAALPSSRGIALAQAKPANPEETSSPPTCRYDDVETAHASYADWSLTLVDTIYRLPAGYAPTDLVSVRTAGIPGDGRVRRLVIDDLRALTRAARADRIELRVSSAYRSEQEQARTFARWTQAYGLQAALLGSARPGHSEHELGTTLDFVAGNGAEPWTFDDWGATPAGRWLAANAWRFGFVLSYPAAGSPVETCYQRESWHYRYFGRTQAAAMHASGLPPRAYLWQRQ